MKSKNKDTKLWAYLNTRNIEIIEILREILYIMISALIVANFATSVNHGHHNYTNFAILIIYFILNILT
jgi:hypothetical protein